MSDRYKLRSYLPKDKQSVHQMIIEEFGHDYLDRSVWKFRKSKPIEKLGLIVSDTFHLHHEEIVASLQYWPIKIAEYKSLLLGPLVVRDHLKGKGIGSLLINSSLKMIKNSGWNFCLVSGEPYFFPKFGFKPVPENLLWPGSIERRRLQYINLRDLHLEKVSNKPLTTLPDIC